MDIRPINLQTVNNTQRAVKTADTTFNTNDSLAIGGKSPETAMAKDLQQLRQMQQVQKTDAPAELGSKKFWTNQATHMTNFFAKASIDSEQGGFYTHLDNVGNVSNPNEKFLMPTSRQVYSYATTYEMTGDKKYLDLAKHGVDFILDNHMRKNEQGEVFWEQRVNRDGSLGEGETDKPLAINEQTYGLTGLIAYYKATKDPAILDVIKSGHEFITNHYHDDANGGFFDSVAQGSNEPATTKSYNSTIYPATSALLDIAEIAEGDWKTQANGQVKELADIFVRNFPDPKTGFIKENFTGDWKEDWRGWQSQPEGSIGVTGHNTQGALFLLRAEKMLNKEGMLTPEESKSYRDTAKQLVDSMLEKTYDKENGGWHDVYVRETGQNMWHTNKPFWQQEEGYLATLAMSKIDPDPKYKQASEQTLKFWDAHFIDRVNGGDHQVVSREGVPQPEPKGGPGKSSYHAVEMGKLAMEIAKW